MPTARALAPLCRVFAPRLAEQSITDPGDEVLDAFRYYAANLNDGRPFVVAAESSRSGEMSLPILDEVRTSSRAAPDVRRRVVAWSRARHRGPAAHVLHGSRSPRLCAEHAGRPGRHDSWAGGARRGSRLGRRVHRSRRRRRAAGSATRVDGLDRRRPSGVDCDVLALLRTKIDGLTGVGGPDAR